MGAGRGVFLRQPHQSEHQDHHCHGKRCILRIHEHVPVERRTQREQDDCGKPGNRSADAPCKPPCHAKADHADDGAQQPSCLEQFERNDLVQQRGRHVEAAAVHVEVGE